MSRYRRRGFCGWLRDLFSGSDIEMEYLEPTSYQSEREWRQEPEGTRSEVTLILDSRDQLLKFTVRLRMWVTTNGEASPNSDANQIGLLGIQRRAQPVAAGRSVLETSELRSELEVALCQRMQVNGSGVASEASCLEVTARDEDVDTLRRYEDSQRYQKLADLRAVIDEYAIKGYERLIADPKRATAWWFAKHPAEIDRLPKIAGTFTELASGLTAAEAAPEPESEPNEEVIRDYTDLIADPKRATAWWFAKHPTEIAQLPKIAGDFAALAGRLDPAAAAPERAFAPESELFAPEPVEPEDSFGAVLDEFLDVDGEIGLAYLDERVHRLLMESGRDDLAKRWETLVPRNNP